ncbi:MAG: GAF domain-containing sensor histidine kinase [Patescibacteria group bacterium]|nr:GAF domain-containing sensor histidine kinase [Patescibacteria group bacterium]
MKFLINIIIVRKISAFLLLALSSLIIFLLTVLSLSHIFYFNIDYVVLFNSIVSLFVAIVFFASVKTFFQKILNKYFFSQLHSKEKILNDLIQKIPKVLNTEQLLDLIICSSRDAMQLKKISLWLTNVSDNKFKQMMSVGFHEKNILNLIKNRLLLRYFSKIRQPIILSKLKTMINNLSDDRIKIGLLKIMDEMKRKKIEIILPLIIRKKIIGVLIIGKKNGYKDYNKQDIIILKTIASQSAIAIENALLYEQTQKFNKTMQAEIKRATNRLQKANKQLRKFDKAKSEFISIASHQLRTPLSIIKGYISLISDGTYGKLNKKLAVPINQVYKSNQRMIDLIDDLLDITRIESNKIIFNFKKIKLENLAKQTIAEFQPIAQEKKLRLKFKCEQNIPAVKMDKVKIKEVLTNLLDNAIKYTNQGSININLKSIKNKRGGFIVLSIIDTGSGIYKEDLPFIFQKFSRGNKNSLIHTEGIGLGLYVCKKIIEAHKGKIGVKSAGKNKGSEFFIKLPI